MHHLHMSAWPASAGRAYFTLSYCFPDKRLHVKFEYYDTIVLAVYYTATTTATARYYLLTDFTTL